MLVSRRVCVRNMRRVYNRKSDNHRSTIVSSQMHFLFNNLPLRYIFLSSRVCVSDVQQCKCGNAGTSFFEKPHIALRTRARWSQIYEIATGAQFEAL
jgi:hypothetical protein